MIILLIFLYYAWKIGFDFFMLIALSCLIFFYPILFFDDISIGFIRIPVVIGAKISIFFSILFLLTVGWFVKKPTNNFVFAYGGHVKFYSNTISFFVFFMMLYIVYDNGFGLHGRAKNEVMENLGYIYKLYSVFSVILISFATITMNRKLLLIAISIVFFDIMYGFRGATAELIIAYFLTRPVRQGINNLRLILYSLFGVLFLTLIKETAYFSNSIGVVIENILNSYDSEGLSFLSIINVEAASISVVYNQVILYDFSIPPIYLVDCFFSIFPFLDKFGYQGTGFSTYFKGIIFGNEGDSFASGMLSVGYALASYFGVALVLTGLAIWGYIYTYFLSTKIFILRVALVSISTILMVSFFRSDLLYLFGLIRSIVLVCFMLYLFHRVTRNHLYVS